MKTYCPAPFYQLHGIKISAPYLAYFLPPQQILRIDLLDAVQLETANRRAQLQASILAASMKECTFQPKTNEALNRKLLQAILQEEDEDPLESIASASTV